MTKTTDTSRYADALGAKLRAAREGQGLSLAMVEERTGGEFKAAIVGAYERGDREISMSRLAGLAGFYQWPVADLLPTDDVPTEPADEPGQRPATNWHPVRADLDTRSEQVAEGSMLFDPSNPEASLMSLADRFGDAQVFALIGFIRDQRADAGNVAGLVRHRLAKRMVDQRAATMYGDRSAARREVAEELGYTDVTRTNFYKLVDGIARNSMTPAYAEGGR